MLYFPTPSQPTDHDVAMEWEHLAHVLRATAEAASFESTLFAVRKSPASSKNLLRTLSIKSRSSGLEGGTFSDLLTTHAAFFMQWQRDPASCRIPGGASFPECQQHRRRVRDVGPPVQHALLRDGAQQPEPQPVALPVESEA